MAWDIQYDEQRRIINCVYAGHVNAEDFQAGTLKTIDLAKQHGTHLIFIDDSGLQSAVSTMEIYDMPPFYDASGARRKSKWAVLLPPDGQIREDVKFYVTICQNRGWYLRAFDDRQAALDWLLRDSDDYRDPPADGSDSTSS
ncbi:MAG: hypothetical protein QNJ22_18725 [Desulfosarcinaceae bacterium]|nr:hypothetical protein [Desulfosarcinaceae bacterium]